MMVFTWSRQGGVECSSKGVQRFSAFYAKMPDGRTIEQHYQCDVKGYDVGGVQWKLGKGRPPLDKSIDLWEAYLNLWKEWAANHPEDIEDLREMAIAEGCHLSDRFATTPINQAHALATILNEMETDNELSM